MADMNEFFFVAHAGCGGEVTIGDPSEKDIVGHSVWVPVRCSGCGETTRLEVIVLDAARRPRRARIRRATRRDDRVDRVLAAAFCGVYVGELIPHLKDVVNNGRTRRTQYLARCPACDEMTFAFSQGRRGIIFLCEAGCSSEAIARVIVQRRLDAGESPEDLWGRADRQLASEPGSPYRSRRDLP